MSEQETILRLVVAAVLGMAIGLERERVGQPAGLRDHALVALGSALIMIVSAYGFQHVTHAPDVVLDPSRIAAQVITGIGFIGAGTIVLRRSVVRGLTTAASVWTAAALGLAAGGGLYFAAGIGTLLTLVILAGIKWIERRFFHRSRRSLVSLDLQRHDVPLEELHAAAREIGVRLDRIDVRPSKESPELDHVDLVIATVDSAKTIALVDALRKRSGVASIQSSIQLPAQ